MTKIVFMGTPASSAPISGSLIEAGYDVQAVVTQLNRPVGRRKVAAPTLVKEVALKYNLLILQPKKISGSPEMEKAIGLIPDLTVTVASRQFLPERTLKTPKLGAINIHASLLPKYRDGAPIYYLITEEEKGTGVMIMEMAKKADAGATLSQRAIPITKQGNVGTIFEELNILGEELLLGMLPKLITSGITPIPQMEEEATPSPNIIRKQGRIDWQKTAEVIDNQVRGMRPWLMAFATYQGTNWKIWAVTPLTGATTNAPGTIIQRSKKVLWITCGEGTVLQTDRLQPVGRGQLTIQESLNGAGQSVAGKDEVD